ncbi:MAG: adhesin, partial [Propionibacteriaceae bacterium]|nr:adhesin [Propionibacteriaceae bacterium]
FSGTADPNADVEIFVDGVSIGTTTADGDGNFSFTPTTPISEGAHTAYVVATDAAGNESRQSNTNGFTVDTTAPAPPVITSPDNGVSTDDTTPPIIGTAEPGSTVTIIIDGEPVGKVRADGDGNFTYTPTTPLTPGPHVITVTATDASGNVSGSSEPVTPTITGGAGNSGGGGDDNGAGNGDNGTGATDDLADTGGPNLVATLAGGLLLVGGCSALAARTLSRRRLI